ncbi:hypothetical protein EOD41_16820 [Mucilaginibacter limnophilus]|uniref:Lipoprotein n=1 Tax=Mucilaginibacter limnophilus TaxID=1932778 RepID=A0A3S3TF76_9SPHI|nr:hypothetical protein [Mucilaginibacter limnophilus]RVT98452.1 hypothetical protein EOD41_16820 [Mucilaginibacter limnophilus]
MKKHFTILLPCIIAAACKTEPDHDGTYIAHFKGQYSVGDDTLIVKDSVVTKRTGYQKIREGKLLAKEHRVKHWVIGSLDAPFLRFEGEDLFIGETIYKKVP